MKKSRSVGGRAADICLSFDLSILEVRGGSVMNQAATRAPLSFYLHILEDPREGRLE